MGEPPKTRPSPMCHNTEFGYSRSNRVCISVEEPTKIGEHWMTGVADSYNKPAAHVSYHAEFGRYLSNGEAMNTGNPKIWGYGLIPSDVGHG